MVELFVEQVKSRLEYVPDGNVYAMFSPDGARKLVREIEALLDKNREKIVLEKGSEMDVIIDPKYRPKYAVFEAEKL